MTAAFPNLVESGVATQGPSTLSASNVSPTPDRAIEGELPFAALVDQALSARHRQKSAVSEGDVSHSRLPNSRQRAPEALDDVAVPSGEGSVRLISEQGGAGEASELDAGALTPSANGAVAAVTSAEIGDLQGTRGSGASEALIADDVVVPGTARSSGEVPISEDAAVPPQTLPPPRVRRPGPPSLTGDEPDPGRQPVPGTRPGAPTTAPAPVIPTPGFQPITEPTDGEGETPADPASADASPDRPPRSDSEPQGAALPVEVRGANPSPMPTGTQPMPMDGTSPLTPPRTVSSIGPETVVPPPTSAISHSESNPRNAGVAVASSGAGSSTASPTKEAGPGLVASGMSRSEVHRGPKAMATNPDASANPVAPSTTADRARVAVVAPFSVRSTATTEASNAPSATVAEAGTAGPTLEQGGNADVILPGVHGPAREEVTKVAGEVRRLPAGVVEIAPQAEPSNVAVSRGADGATVESRSAPANTARPDRADARSIDIGGGGRLQTGSSGPSSVSEEPLRIEQAGYLRFQTAPVADENRTAARVGTAPNQSGEASKPGSATAGVRVPREATGSAGDLAGQPKRATGEGLSNAMAASPGLPSAPTVQPPRIERPEFRPVADEPRDAAPVLQPPRIERPTYQPGAGMPGSSRPPQTDDGVSMKPEPTLPLGTGDADSLVTVPLPGAEIPGLPPRRSEVSTLQGSSLDAGRADGKQVGHEAAVRRETAVNLETMPTTAPAKGADSFSTAGLEWTGSAETASHSVGVSVQSGPGSTSDSSRVVPMSESGSPEGPEAAMPPSANVGGPMGVDAGLAGAGQRSEVRKDGKAPTTAAESLSEQARRSSGTPVAEQGTGMKKGRKPSKAAEETLHILPVDRKGLAGTPLPTISSRETSSRRSTEWNRPVENDEYRLATSAPSNPRWEPGRDFEVAGEIRVKDHTNRIRQIESFVAREAGVIRKSGAQSLSVVLRPDTQTELVIDLSQSAAGVEATVRCHRGEFPAARGEWEQLRDALAAQNIRLAPPVEAVAAAVAADTSGGHGSRYGASEERFLRGQQPFAPQQQSQQNQQQHQHPQQHSHQQGSSQSRQESGYDPRYRSGTAAAAGEKSNPASPRPARRAGWESWA